MPKVYVYKKEKNLEHVFSLLREQGDKYPSPADLSMVIFDSHIYIYHVGVNLKKKLDNLEFCHHLAGSRLSRNIIDSYLHNFIKINKSSEAIELTYEDLVKLYRVRGLYPHHFPFTYIKNKKVENKKVENKKPKSKRYKKKMQKKKMQKKMRKNKKARKHKS